MILTRRITTSALSSVTFTTGNNFQVFLSNPGSPDPGPASAADGICGRLVEGAGTLAYCHHFLSFYALVSRKFCTGADIQFRFTFTAAGTILLLCTVGMVMGDFSASRGGGGRPKLGSMLGGLRLVSSEGGQRAVVESQPCRCNQKHGIVFIPVSLIVFGSPESAPTMLVLARLRSDDLLLI